MLCLFDLCQKIYACVMLFLHFVFIHICTYGHHLHVSIFMNMCVCVCMYVYMCVHVHVCAFMSENNLWESVPLQLSACLDQTQVVMLDGRQQYSLIYTATIMSVSLFIFIFESKEVFENNTQAWI